MFIVYLLLFFAEVYAYLKKQYTIFLLCFIGLMTKVFMLDSSESVLVKGEDLCLLSSILLLPIAYSRNRSAFYWRNDRIIKWIYLFVLFYILELLMTVISGSESLLNSVKVIRISFVLLSFFVFRPIPLSIYPSFFKIVFFITLCQSFLFFLQFFGIHVLAGATDTERIDSYGIHYEVNMPLFTLFFLFFSLKANYLKGHRPFFTSLFVFVVLFTFVRATILTVIVGIIYFAFFQSKSKQKHILIILMLIMLPISNIFIGIKSAGSDDKFVSTDITNVLNASDFSNIDKSSGTFSFRIAMLAERIIYLIDNPQYLLSGVGTVHESSPSTLRRFDFSIGTPNADMPLGRCIIESGDITWLPIVLRYGFIGIILHMFILVLVVMETKKRKDILMILTPLYIGLIISTFTGPFFEHPRSLFMLSFYFAIISRAKYEKKQLII